MRSRAPLVSAQEKIGLKALLKDMADEGLIDSAPGRAFHKMGGLPKVTVLRVVDVDDGGNVWGQPERWEADGIPIPACASASASGEASASASACWHAPRKRAAAGSRMS